MNYTHQSQEKWKLKFRKTCTKIFTAALITTAKNLKQSDVLHLMNWLKNDIKYMKSNTIQQQWMNFCYIQMEVSQMHYTKWKKPVQYNSIHIKFKKGVIMGKENKSVIAKHQGRSGLTKLSEPERNLGE